MTASITMRKTWTNALAAFGMIALLAAPAVGQGRQPSGTITLETTSIGFIFGAEWGGGTINFRGKTYPVRVRVFEAGVIGAQATTFTGRIFNARSIADIAGIYAAGGATATLGAGGDIATLKNSKGVVIELRGSSAGLAAKLAGKGFDLQLR